MLTVIFRHRNSYTLPSIVSYYCIALEIMPPLSENKNLSSASDCLLILLITIAVIAAYLAVPSARGTDQFWYIADTETIAETGRNHSNLTMPGVVLRENTGSPPTWFYHNGPLLYLNAFIASLTKVETYTIWKFNNFLFFLCSALLVSLIVGTATSRQFGFYAFALYSLSPLNIWLAVNALQEIFYALLFAVQLYITLRHRDSVIGFLVLLATLVVGAYSHPFFKLMTLSIAVIYLLDKRYLAGAALTLALAGVVLTDTLIFPSSFPPDISTLIAYSVPGKSNSLWHQSDYNLTVTPALLLQKLTTALTIQFTDLSAPILSLLTYLSVPAFLLLVFRRSHISTTLLTLCFIAFSLYAGIVILLQFQVRYQQIIAPAAVILVTIALFAFFKNRAISIVVVLAVAFFAIDLKLISRARTDSALFNQSSNKFAEFIERFPTDDRVAFINERSLGTYLHLVSAARPRQTMVIGTGWLSDDNYHRAIELFEPNVLIYSESERNKSQFSDNLTEISDFHKVGKLYYEIPKTQ